MSQERRKHPRVAVPIDGQWRSPSGGHFCRVLNVSLGGCFAHSTTAPGPAEITTLTMYFGKHGPLSIKGKVTHAEPKAGFGFEFEELKHEPRLQLSQLLDSLKTGDY